MTKRSKPRRPCEARTIRSQERNLAASSMAAAGALFSIWSVSQSTARAAAFPQPRQGCVRPRLVGGVVALDLLGILKQAQLGGEVVDRERFADGQDGHLGPGELGDVQTRRQPALGCSDPSTAMSMCLYMVSLGLQATWPGFPASVADVVGWYVDVSSATDRRLFM